MKRLLEEVGMFRKVTVVISVLMLLGLAPSLIASPRVFVKPRFGFYSGPAYHGYPNWYRGPVYFPAPITGELKIKTEDKDARVYVDGGYLGIVRKISKFDLRPGNHDIELRDARGNALFEQRVAIVPGRTTEFHAEGSAD
jgi:hypothetical protein